MQKNIAYAGIRTHYLSIRFYKGVSWKILDWRFKIVAKKGRFFVKFLV